ncbi:helix-turn-helix domain-containing protein [Trichococcus flocculiformis]|uniref:helix-turn-helix domain-containing protein n=1 Tax=Trichococcus flocculiformis TaxID=82803 RepID=UPI003DA2F7C8
MLDTIKELCTRRGISINDLEEALGYPKNTLYRLKRQNPGADKLEAIADYFGVTTDYLLGRTDQKDPYWKLNDKEEKDIAKEVEKIISGLDDGNGAEVNFYGEPMTEEQKMLFMNSLEMALRMAKEESKKKFTPKKYRDK